MRLQVRLAVAFVLLCAPGVALAQRTTTGTVIGKIVDSSGAVLPGVNVSLQSPEALGQFSGLTDNQGQYRVTNLPPATYDVRAELSGFQTVIRRATVRLNAVTETDFTLSVGSVSETVRVTAESPTVDPERAGLSVNINNQALTTVPVTTNRRFQDAWLVVPGVSVNPATQELTGSERRTSLDGADVTDPYGGDIFAVNLNYDAIQDVEVKALGSEASDGSSMVGQYMNIVTKSGGNDVHGSAALFVIAQRFNGTNVQGIPANQRQDYQPDLTLGGPIKRDRVWFFSAYRRVQTDQTFNNATVPVQRRESVVPERHHAIGRQSAPAGQPPVRPHDPGQRDLPRHSRAESQSWFAHQLDARRTEQRDAANRRAIRAWHADQRRTAGQHELQLGRQCDEGVSVRRQLHDQQAKRSATERRPGHRSDEGDPNQPRRQHPRQPDDHVD
jgi:hypothetical protein